MLWDFFDKQYKSEILSMLKQKIITDGRKDDVFSMEEIDITEIFAITKGGIFFVYNNYEIGPYSSGIFEFYFPFKRYSLGIHPRFI